MKKITLLFLLIGISLNAQIPANYYDSADGLTGYTLKSQLRSIISNGHINRDYDDLYNGYQTTDTDYYYENDGTVLDMYSENPNGQDPYNYTHGNSQCGNYSDEGDCYNREHLMPQSWFNSASPMVSDIHHVVPSDGKVNGQRDHYPLANVGSASWTSLNGSMRGTCSDTGYSGIVFEPIDEFKGDIARIYFYMATRYETEIGSWETANSDGSDPVLDGSSDHVFEDWYLDVLIQWHNQDPVSQREIDRNNAAYDYQGNANPFIDHPEYVQTIWNPTPDTQAPTAPTNLTVQNISSDGCILTWTAATDDVGVSYYEIFQDDVSIGTTPTLSYTVTGLNSETNYNFYIVAYDSAPNNSPNSNTITITTLATPNYLIFEDFNNCNTIDVNFSTYSEQSTKNWECSDFGENNSGCMQMNGYQEDEPSKDWLITTNKIVFSQYTNEKLSIYLAHTYGTMSLELLYSTNYDGISNPINYTWTSMPNVTIDVPDGSTNEVIQIITNVDISSLTEDAYVAFKYYSNGSPTRWTVDNFKIEGDNLASINTNNFANTISLYPNPSNDIVKIKSIFKISEINVYDLLGKLVLNDLKTNIIRLKNLPKGIYVCKIITENNNKIYKRIVKN